MPDKVWTGEEEVKFKENVAFNTILFGFSYYYNKKPYLSGMLQHIQLLIWKAGITILKGMSYDFSAKLLEHSLQHYPQDITILNNDLIIEKIKADKTSKIK